MSRSDDPALDYELLPYLREEELPHTMCPGCGGGTVLNTFAKAVDEMDDLSVKDLLLVSGIGCSAWIPSPNFEADTLHTTHGRAVAFASGAKAGNPDQETIVLSGDGDLAGIGGNHLLHAARRNIDITVVLVNNFTYGMTGGQVAPTTPHGSTTTTSPYGNPEDAIDISAVAKEAGGAFVARGATSRPHQLVQTLQTGIEKEGFSLIEVYSQCPTVYGRRNDLRSAPEMLEWMEEQITDGEFEVGTIVDRDRDEFIASMDDIAEAARTEHKPEDRQGAGTTGEDYMLRIAGEGGQGVVVAGTILGEGAALDGRHVFKTEEYGSRARGGVAHSDLIVADDKIHEAKVPEGDADVLVALTDEALADHWDVLDGDGMLFVDADLVEDAPEEATQVSFSAFAREAGNERATNMALVGYLNERLGLANEETLVESIGANLDAMLDVNQAAFERGVEAASEE
ncbi:MAG: 2-oxoglutarate ferredoxin oxidoreductase subunit beta [Halobacteriales archaeon]|jgi:2-oxoglutarate ferredoxin oxidoreductase subunit beta